MPVRTLALSLGGILICGSVLAVDGVTLINQSKALAGGITADDTPGFPVTISRPGSYRLSGTLTVPDAATTAIVVTSTDVTIDLNGYMIRGPVDCGYSGPIVCTPAGSGTGVFVAGTGAYANVAVLNGTIRGMGGSAIRADIGRPGLVISDLRILHNGQSGLSVSGAMVRGVLVARNGSHGVSGNALNVSSSLFMGNDGWGVFGNSQSGVLDTAFSGNVSGAFNSASGGAKSLGGNLCNGTPC